MEQCRRCELIEEPSEKWEGYKQIPSIWSSINRIDCNLDWTNEVLAQWTPDISRGCDLGADLFFFYFKLIIEDRPLKIFKGNY